MPRKVLNWIYDRQWAITKDALETIISIADRDELIKANFKLDEQALQAIRGNPLPGSMRSQVRDNIAIIPVYGPIFPRANILTAISGATSAEMIAQDFTAALNDPSVKAIVFDIDSPGGEITGIADLSSLIFNAGGGAGKKDRSGSCKAIISHIGGLGASAAYWIASPADQVVISETAKAGSIGVVGIVRDTSQSDKEQGIHTFVSSQSPNKRVPITSETGQGKIQAIVDSLASVFIRDVARNRGTDEDDVIENFGQGDVFVGAQAVAQGLADSVGSLEDVISNLKAQVSTIKIGGIAMPMTKEELKANEPELYNEIVAEGRQEAKSESSKAASSAGEAAAQAENERLKGCEALETPENKELVAQHKYDRSMTPEKLSLIIMEDAKKKEEARKKLHKQETASTTEKLEGLGFVGGTDDSAMEVNAIIKEMAEGASFGVKESSFVNEK